MYVSSLPIKISNQKNVLVYYVLSKMHINLNVAHYYFLTELFKHSLKLVMFSKNVHLHLHVTNFYICITSHTGKKVFLYSILVIWMSNIKSLPWLFLQPIPIQYDISLGHQNVEAFITHTYTIWYFFRAPKRWSLYNPWRSVEHHRSHPFWSSSCWDPCFWWPTNKSYKRS